MSPDNRRQSGGQGDHPDTDRPGGRQSGSRMIPDRERNPEREKMPERERKEEQEQRGGDMDR